MSSADDIDQYPGVTPADRTSLPFGHRVFEIGCPSREYLGIVLSRRRFTCNPFIRIFRAKFSTRALSSERRRVTGENTASSRELHREIFDFISHLRINFLVIVQTRLDDLQFLIFSAYQEAHNFLSFRLKDANPMRLFA